MQSIVEAVLEHSKVFPDKEAIIHNDTTITYYNLAEKIKAFAFSLKGKKITKGSRIIMEADDLISYFCSFLGCQLYGCIAVPIEKDISIYKLQELYKTTKPKLVFIKNNGEDYRDYFQPAQKNYRDFPLPKDDSVCAVIGTTGTTGKSSLVSHTNKSMTAEVENLSNGININADTVLFTNIPFDLAAGYRRVLATLYQGGTVIVTHQAFSLETVSCYNEKYHITHLSLISSDLSSLINLKNSETMLKGIKYIESATGELPSDITNIFYQKFPDTILYNVYGTTESGCILINNTREVYNEKCLGIPSCHAQISLVDEKGEEIHEPGKYGYVAVTGSMNMQGYYKKKDLTEKVMGNGKLVLNDIVYFDEKGYYYFVSRVGDIINVKGHKIPPINIEKVALELEEIKDCACVAKDDLNCGQIPVLYIECADKESFDAQKLTSYLEKNLESYCIPKEIIPIEKIPRTTTGKLMRKSLSHMNETKHFL